MPSETYSQPIAQLLDGRCEYECFSTRDNSFSADISRIYHIHLPDEALCSQDIVMTVFTIRNQKGKWKIHSEGRERTDPGSMVPVKNASVALAHKYNWKYVSIAIAGENVSSNELISKYVISIESYDYGNATVYDLSEELEELAKQETPKFYRKKIISDGSEHYLCFVRKDCFFEYISLFDNRPYERSLKQYLLTKNNEQQFKDWMSAKDVVVASTIIANCKELKKAKTRTLIADIIPCDNLFNIDDAEEIKVIKEKLENHSNYNEFNEGEGHSNGNALHSALGNYYEFLVWKHSRVTEDASLFSNNEIINKVSSYVKYKGFRYSSKLIENFYLSLISKPFVILAGISGTGKTRLVKLFAEAIGANYENGRYNLIPVRPDWSDSSDLFGHLDLNGHFIEGPVTKVVKKANEDLEHPYFICLDEMNLARVEYYLSDFLSVVESRKKIDSGGIVAEVPLFIIPPHKELDEDGNEIEIEEKTIKLTDNIYVIGTVNMDETTFPFSKKVLDRANTIEFSDVDLEVNNEIEAEQPILDNVSNDFLCSKYVVLNDCKIHDMTGEDREKTIEKWINQLSSINDVLKKLDMHIGYRVRDELLFYMLYNNSCGENGVPLIDEKEAFNNQVMQKILPRIQGSNPELRKVLISIFNVCVSNEDKEKLIQDKDDEALLNEMKAAGGDSPLAKKIMTLIQRLSNDGYTKFWI